MRSLSLLLLCGVTISALYVNRDKRKEVCKIDLVILVDRSGSIVKNGPEHWTTVKTFLKEIVNSYTIGEDATRIAMVSFANHVRVEFNFDEENMDEKIDSMKTPDGYTSTASALAEGLNVLQQGKREDSSSVVLVITDGLSTQNMEGNRIEDGDTDPETVKLRNEYIQEAIAQGNIIRSSTGAKILVLGVTDHVNKNEKFRKLADEGSYFTSDNFEDLMNNVAEITKDSCKQVSTGSCTLDVAFAVDMSGSVGTDAATLKEFLRTLTSQLQNMDPRIHTALIRFANKARILKPLDAFGENAMQDAINEMSGPDGYTATADALVKASQVFNGKDGDRSGRGNVLVVISDGLPTKALNGTRVEKGSSVNKDYVEQEVLQKAEELRKNYQVEIFTVVIEGKTDTDLELLKDISFGVQPVEVEKFSDLMEHLGAIKDKICTEDDRKRENTERQRDDILREILSELLERRLS